MTTVSVADAQVHLTQWINRALSGEKIVIAQEDETMVMLSPVKKVKKQRKIGNEPNFIVSMSGDFDEPLEDFQEYMK
ncbi:MAG: type II toxin-antitoxin system prevent-host-death family antitoxin [Bacteroidia bacterium]|nr:type II toxin-antitoxin system prevent-host-death family antitoxin [Bacteroidia bacterium]